jgi:hypothetical protein
MAAQLPGRGRHWGVGIPRRRASLMAGLLLPVVLAVGAIAGPSPAAPIRQATNGHTASQPATTVQMIGGHLPLALTPAVPVGSVGSNDRHLSQSPFGAASGRVTGSRRSSRPGTSGQHNGTGQGQCQHQPPAYPPGRVFAKGRADGQSGGPVAATPPGGPVAATPPGGPVAATPLGGPGAARPPGGVAAATQAQAETATTPPQPEAATRRGQTTLPAVHVSPSQPTTGSLMQGIPQTQRQVG